MIVGSIGHTIFLTFFCFSMFLHLENLCFFTERGVTNPNHCAYENGLYFLKAKNCHDSANSNSSQFWVDCTQHALSRTCLFDFDCPLKCQNSSGRNYVGNSG